MTSQPDPPLDAAALQQRADELLLCPPAAAEVARLAAEGRHDGVHIRLDPRRQFATPGELDDYLHAAAGPAGLLELPGADPGPDRS
jgi:hypothetical protein